MTAIRASCEDAVASSSGDGAARLQTGRFCVTLCALALMVAGCARQRGPLPPTPAADPTALLAQVRANEERIGSLRARFTANTSAGGEERRTDGVLLVKKPNRFRMRLMLPFGPTIFDYVSWGERSQLTLPLQGSDSSAPPPGVAPFSRADVDEAFLRGSHAFPGTCMPRRDSGAVVVLCRDAGGALLRRLNLDPNTGTIGDETSFEGGVPRMVLRYGDYRAVGDQYMPFHVTMIYPQRDLSVDITISSYELNPQLSDALFEPSRPWGS